MKRMLEILRTTNELSIAGYRFFAGDNGWFDVRHPHSLCSPPFPLNPVGLRAALRWMDQQNYSDEEAL